MSILHARFIDMLTCKAALVGIRVEVWEESYTSKASFLDLDAIPNYTSNDEEERVFSRKRIGRRSRLYRAKDGRFLQAYHVDFGFLCPCQTSLSPSLFYSDGVINKLSTGKWCHLVIVVAQPDDTANQTRRIRKALSNQL